MINNIFILKSNEDWKEIHSESIVDINNDSYWGFRSMENNAKMIIYNPFEINNLVRITKDGSKFKTIHGLVFDNKLFSSQNIENNINLFINKYYEITDIVKNNNIVILKGLSTKDELKVGHVIKEILKIETKKCA